MVGQEHWHLGNPPVPPEHRASLPVDVVVPVQVQDAAGHLTGHSLQGQQVWGHGLGPPAAPQVPLQVTLRAVPLSPCVPSSPGGTAGSRAQGLTSGQNSITSRYGVTSAHWARHCSRLVCWRALCGAQQRGALCTTILPVLGLAWEGWWQPPRNHCPSCARGMAPGPGSHRPVCTGAATGAAGSEYQHVPAPGMCHKGTFVQLCWGRSSPMSPRPLGPALPMTSLLPWPVALHSPGSATT